MSTSTKPPPKISNLSRDAHTQLIKTGAQTVFQALITGTSAGFATELVLYPIEGGLKPHVASLNFDIHHPTHANVRINYAGIAKDISQIMITKAPITGTNIGSLLISSGLLMASYETVRFGVKTYVAPEANPYALAFGGAIAAQLLESFIWTPFNEVRSHRDAALKDIHSASATSGATASVTPNKPHYSLRQSFHDIWNTKGYKGLYKGYWATFVTTAPFLAFYYVFSEIANTAITKTLQHRQQKEHPGTTPAPITLQWYHNAGAGVVAGLSSLLLTTPLEFFRQRIMTEWEHRYDILKAFRESGFIRTSITMLLHTDLSNQQGLNPENKEILERIRSRCRVELKTKAISRKIPASDFFVPKLEQKFVIFALSISNFRVTI